jgi:uncharacterized membrane protein (UPF0127 family)
LVRKAAVLIPAALVSFSIGLAGIIFMPDEIKNRSIDFDKGTIKIDNSIINVEIAESDVERQRWLKFRDDKFQSNSGMIIVYPKLDYHELWLINILYNLDIMWFDENGNLVYMKKNEKPCENILDPQKCTVKTTIPAKYIVVSSSGFIQENNITNSSKLTTISI